MSCVPAMAHNWKQLQDRTEAFVTAAAAATEPDRARRQLLYA